MSGRNVIYTSSLLSFSFFFPIPLFDRVDSKEEEEKKEEEKEGEEGMEGEERASPLFLLLAEELDRP